MKKLIYTTIFILSFSICSFAQEEEKEEKTSSVSFDLGADITSSFIWRGLLIDPTPQIQGWAEVGFGNLFIGSWGAANFQGTYTETDVYLGYAAGNYLSMSILKFWGEF